VRLRLSGSEHEWLRAKNDERARADFTLARDNVISVPGLSFGKISVLVSIAEAQSKNGMIEQGQQTFQSAIELALRLPSRPRFVQGLRRPPTPAGAHYKDEAFDKILNAAIHVRNVQILNAAAAAWKKSGDNVGSAVVDAWLAHGGTNEAIAAARGIEDADARVSALLSLARNLLDDAGAPVFRLRSSKRVT